MELTTELNAAFLAMTFTLTTPLGLPRSAAAQSVDPLASWNDGAAKQQILAFVKKVTGQQSPDFVPEAQRIAVFDQVQSLR